MSMITATAWIPKGYAAEFPTRYELDDEELDRVSKLAQLRLDDAKGDLVQARKDKPKGGDDDWEDEDDEDDDDDDDDDVEDGGAEGSNGVKLPRSTEEQDDDLQEYDLENYDTDPEDRAGGNLDVFGNSGSLAFYPSNREDPYLTAQGEEDDDEEDREDLQILPTDNVVLAAKAEDELAHLEVYVYEDSEDNLYVHHDIMLPALPICLEWLDVAVGNDAKGKPVDQGFKSNFVAVGTFEPDIEIWNLDMIDCMYPNAILGQGGEEADGRSGGGKKKKKKKSKKVNDAYHVDAVISLAANRNHRTLLASGSADKTIKLWDLATCKCAKSYSYHTDRVCSLAWHPTETTALLSGSYDRTVVAADMRAPDSSKPRWGVESDVEQVRWDPRDPNFFFVSTESGQIHYHDARTAPSDPSKTKSVWSLQAHDSEISAFDINRHVPGFLATGGQDKEVKLWNISAGAGPSLVVSRNVNVGKVFSANFAPDEDVAFRLAVAGSRGAVQVWDTSTNAAVRRVFADKVGKLPGDAGGGGEEVKERVVGIDRGIDDDDDDDSDEEDEDDDDDDDDDDEDGADGDGDEAMKG